MAETRREKLAREMTNWQAGGASGRPLADWVGEIAGRARSLAEAANPAEWWRQLGPDAWAALAPAIEARMAQGGEANAGAPGYQQMLDTAMNFGFGPMGMIGQTVFHGSPHKWAPEPGFPAGRPRLDKIGTGEGAQAYGHGMYFAESPGVAKEYAERLAANIGDYIPVPYAGGRRIENTAAIRAVGSQIVPGRTMAEAKEIAKRMAGETISAKEIDAVPDDLIFHNAAGEIYSLDLPDEKLPSLLDWDKPLSEQPEAVRKALEANPQIQQYIAGQEAMKKTLNEMYPKRLEKLPRIAAAPVDPKGSMIYEALMRRNAAKMPDGAISVTDWETAGDPATQVLKAAGIPGLRYLDAGSRTGSGGTSNYVVWDQAVLDEMGRRMAKAQGLLPESIPDELGVGAPAERVAQWRKARENAALPVEQGGLGLRPDNTAAERAKAMGFEGGWGHGSPSPKVEELRGSATGAEGPGAYATNFLPETGLYSGNLPGATVYPLSVRAGRALDVGPANPYEVLNAKDDADLLAKLAAARKEAIVRTQERTPDWLIKNGAPLMPERQHFVSTKPGLFRSRFAAFDPKRQHEADLLASWLLPLTLGGGALGYGLFGQPTTD